jgi:hypothetical protein
VLIWNWMTEEELAVHFNSFFFLYLICVHLHGLYIIYSTFNRTRRPTGSVTFAPFAAGVYCHNARRPQRDSDLQLQELLGLVSESADARRDAAPPSATRPPPHAPRVDHDPEPIPRSSACRHTICHCVRRLHASVYIES